MAGFAHWLLYHRKPANLSILKDIHLSILSTGVFALATAVIMTLHEQGWTKLHIQIRPETWWYLPLSYLAVLVLQDAYFYATHRPDCPTHLIRDGHATASSWDWRGRGGRSIRVNQGCFCRRWTPRLGMQGS